MPDALLALWDQGLGGSGWATSFLLFYYTVFGPTNHLLLALPILMNLRLASISLQGLWTGISEVADQSNY